MAWFWAWLRRLIRSAKPQARRPRRMRPGISFLEGRQTPSVTAVSFAAITPAPGAKDTVQVSGVIVDDHVNAVGAGLKATFQVAQFGGPVSKTGPVTLTPLAGNDTGFSFPIAFSPADRGNREVISITAFDQDNQAAHTTVAAHTVVQIPSTERPGYRDISLGSNGNAGDFQGIIHGRGTVGRTTGGASVVSGHGTYIIDGASDLGRYHASGKGNLTVKADPMGAIDSTLDGKTAFAFSKGAAAGLDATVQGHSAFDRGIDRSLEFNASGTFIPAAAINNSQLQGAGKGQATLRSNGSGHFALSLTGHLVLKGNSPLHALLGP